MSQVAPAYIAMMAIAETSDRLYRLAIFVGTDEPPAANAPPRWFVSFADADKADAWFSAGGEPTDAGFATVFDVPPPIEILRKFFQAGDVGVSDGAGNDVEARMAPVNGPNAFRRLWIDHLIRVHFYTRADDQVFRFGEVSPPPFVRLDTAGFVFSHSDNGNPDELVTDPEWVVSRVRLDARLSWAEFEQRNSPKTELDGYRVVCHVPVAVNAHEPLASDAGRAKQFDTRAVLIAEARKRDQLTGLWATTAPFAPAFRAIDLKFSDADGVKPPGPVVPGNPHGDFYDLSDLTGDDRAFYTDSTKAALAPIFAGIPAFSEVAPINLIAVRRQIGFRVIDGSATRVLRIELHIAIAEAAHWLPVWDGIARSIAGISAPGSLQTSNSDPCLILAQEQLLGDVATNFGGVDPIEWRVTARVEQGSGSTSIERLAERAIVQAQRLALSPLRSLRPETGMSTIPSIDIDGASPLSWYAVGALKPTTTNRRIYLGSTKPTPWWAARRKGEVLRFQSLQPVLAEDAWKRVPRWRFRPLKLDLSTISRVDGEPLALSTAPTAFLEAINDARSLKPPVSPDASRQPIPDDGICFQLVSRLPPGSVPQQVRIGAFQFDLSAGSTFIQTIRLRLDDKDDRPPRSLLLTTRLEVAGALPIEQDRLGGRRRRDEKLDEPVMIRLGDRIVSDQALELNGHESFSADTDQELEWRFRGPHSRTSGKLLIIDPQPFRVAAVEYGFQPSADDNVIALWRRSDDGRFAWRVQDPDQTVRMLLPPQIIGEAMERYRGGGVLSDIDPGKPAPARFGSLTRVDFDPTYRETGTREPSWNLRRVFDRVADAAPGALVRDVRFELAYGLVVRHQPQRETWLTELSGVIGAAPDGLPEGTSSSRFLSHGNKLLRLADHRLAVDKIWSGRPERRFETSEGLTFTLRSKGGGHGPRTKLRFPVVGGYPGSDDQPRDKRIRETFEDPAGATSNGFAGGVAWAFPSANLLVEAYSQPLSTTGRISDLFFSALGGWGQQRAAFAQGKSVIETETAMGRLAVYKLERLGRIGGLGHRAKHVIVYRRTVAPSAQFFNRPPIGEKQDEHAGRPILRKVEEYVDILEPERRYPEKGTSSREPGCLSGARFISRRIRVDSEWGEDVRKEGWMVPLWRTDMANQAKINDPRDPDSPANIYPKPLVQLLMPGESGDEVPLAIDTPERLVFYTSTVDGETADNIDDWRAVEGIDFCDAPAPRLETVNWRYTLHDGMLPPAPRSAGGHDRLTLGLVDGQVPIRLGAGRVETSPAAALKNVTISRARPHSIPVGTGSGPQETAQIAGDEASVLAASLRAQLDAMFGKISGRFEALGREVLGGRQRAIRAVDETRNELQAELKGLHDQITKEASNLSTKLAQTQFDPTALADKVAGELRKKLTTERDRLKVGATGAIMLGAADALGRADDLSNRWYADLDKAIKQWNDIVVGQPIKEIQENARALLEDLIREFEALRADVLHANAEINSLLSQLSPRIDGIRRQLDFRPELQDGRDRIASELVEISAAIAKTRQAVAGWQPFGDSIEVETRRSEIRAIVADARRALLVIIERLQTLATTPGIRSLPRPPQTVGDTELIANAIKGLQGLEAGLRALDTEAQNFVFPPGDFQILKGRLDTLVAQVETGLAAAGTELDKVILGALSLNQTLLDRFDAIVVQVRQDCWTAVLSPLAVKAQIAADAINASISAAKAFLDAAETATNEAVGAAQQLAATMRRDVSEVVEKALSEIQSAVRSAQDEMLRGVQTADKLLADGIDNIVKEARVYLIEVGTFVASANGIADGLQKQIAAGLGTATTVEGEIKSQIDAFADALIATINSVSDEIDAARRAVEAAVAEQARRIAGRLESYLGGVERELSRQFGVQSGDIAGAADKARHLYQEGDNVLRLIRAVGDPPKTDALGLNRPEVAYVFDVLKPVVDVTPALALVNRVTDTAAAVKQAADAAGKLLESFGIRLPVGSLGEDLVPDQLKNLSLGKLFPDFAGLNLESLLKNAGFPDLSGKDSQGVKITRGFDKDRREAWLAAEIDVKLSRSEAILDIGPIALMIDEGHFRAETRIAMGADGRFEKEAKGQIAGDWRLVTAGMDIITFEKTPLLFDKSGKIDFKIATDRVRLAPTLEFLTNLMAKVGKAVPAGVEPIMRGGVPAGLITKLSMQLPPVQTGAFGITDLSLAASFGIIAIPEFEIVASLDIASRDAPFTLAVWLLNGGGYVTQRLSYRPMGKPTPVISYTLDVAILAGVGIGFGFGVVSGGVWLQVGCSVALSWTTGGGGNVTTVTAFLLARGNVDVAGLVSASIMLRLEISYDGSTMVARGTLRLSFRISMFYTLRVNQAARYQLAGERRAAPSDDYAESFG